MWLLDPLFSPWLEEPKESDKARCKLCTVAIRHHKTDLLCHRRTKIHQCIAKSIINPSVAKVLIKVNNISRMEIKMSLFTACHSSIRSVDHLCDLFNNELTPTLSSNNATSSSHTDTAPLKLHRTKATAIIKNVISKELLLSQVEAINNSKFWPSTSCCPSKNKNGIG